MRLIDYIQKSEETAIYPNKGKIEGLGYVSFGLMGESGEIAEIIKKIIRDDNSNISENKKQRLFSECGDVCWYCSQNIIESGVNYPVLNKNIKVFQNEMTEKFKSSVFNGRSTLEIIQACVYSIGVRSSNIMQIYIDNMFDNKTPKEEDLDKIAKDSITSLAYIAILIDSIGGTLEEVMQKNITKLQERKSTGTLKGSGETTKERKNG